MSDVPTTRVPADKLRYDLIDEEFGELGEAIENFDVVEIADALGDIEYVVDGAVLVFGLEELSKGYEGEDSWHSREDGVASETTRQLLLEDLKKAILRNNADNAAYVLQVIRTETRKAAAYFNIDLDYVVNAIHKSNLTKLGENGEVIRRPEDNKVLKGPNYKEPTGDIRAYLYDGVKDVDLLG
jgi:predicted HAD superfamily Cof-like phosphohydrolase